MNQSYFISYTREGFDLSPSTNQFSKSEANKIIKTIDNNFKKECKDIRNPDKKGKFFIIIEKLPNGKASIGTYSSDAKNDFTAIDAGKIALAIGEMI